MRDIIEMRISSFVKIRLRIILMLKENAFFEKFIIKKNINNFLDRIDGIQHLVQMKFGRG